MSARGFKAEVVDLLPGRGGGHQVGHDRGDRRVRLRLPARRGRRAPPHPHLAVRRLQPPADQLRLGVGGARGGRRRGQHPRGRAARGRLPLLGAGRAGGQHGRLGGAHHAPADRTSWCRCQNERSQLRNRDTAMRILKARLFEIAEKKQKDELAAADRGTRRRSPSAARSAPTRSTPSSGSRTTAPSSEIGNVEARDGRRDRRVHQGLSPVGAEPAGVSERDEATSSSACATTSSRRCAGAAIDPFGGRYPGDPLGRAAARAAGPGDRGGAEGGRAREPGRPRRGAAPSRQDVLRPPHGPDRAHPALRAGRSARRRLRALHRAGHRRLRRRHRRDDAHAHGRAHGGREGRSRSWPSRCGRCPRSGTASRTWRRATGSATSTSS